MPDCIVPMPVSRLRMWERGYNQSLLIAQALSEILEIPVRDVLRRRSGDYSQAGLNHYQRLQMQDSAVYLKKGVKLHDQCVLLVDDVMTTGRSLQCSAKALFEGCPGQIFAITVCRALD
jgi:ComF family protein